MLSGSQSRILDPFDLDDHRRRRVTELDRELAEGIREAEAKRPAATTVEVINCPECEGSGACTACGGMGQHEDDHDADGNCSTCAGTGHCVTCDGTGESDDCVVVEGQVTG